MLEGYTLFNHELTRAIARAAKAAGCQLALDLASFEVVQANRAVLDELLSGQVDLVFANEDEATAWQPDLEQALTDLARRARVAAVVKLGAQGAWIQAGETRHRVNADKVETVIDTTGAGDNWAAGFLAGYLRGLPLDRCGQLGSQAGAAVVQKLGAQPEAADWRRLRGWLDAWA
jgi:sugar/nucleoside kinase (ribokinase family)